MKKISVVLLFLVILLLPGCLTGHYHMGPAPVENEMWVCDEVDMWFYGSRYGEMVVNDEVIPLNVYVDDWEFYVYIENPPVLYENDMIIAGKPIYPKSDLYLQFHRYDFDYFTVELKKNYDHHRYEGILDDNDEIKTLTFRKVMIEDTSTEE